MLALLATLVIAGACSTHSGHIVLVEMAFLDGFAMVSLGVGQTEQSLLEEVAGDC